MNAAPPIAASPEQSAAGTPQPTAAAGANPATPSKAIARDPLAYIRQVAENTRRLAQYTVTFTRSERRGLLRQLQGPERIAAWFRRSPFSVRLKWLDENIKYGESVYVAGVAGNKVRFIPRAGFLGLPPAVTLVDLQTPVTWGESRYPLTTFGLERLMERTLETLDRAGPEAIVTYHGVVPLPDDGRAAHHLHLAYPQDRFPECFVDLYVDARNDLPAASVLRRADGRLEAAYNYNALDANVTLKDDDFVLDAERRTPATLTAGN
ncbi:MAG: DUF1571 domain-containing protein [Phycisphaerae bacterium]